MSKLIDTAKVELTAVANDVRSAFGAFSLGQLNWKPSEKGWSIAQCLDHLIVTHSLYFPDIQRLTAGTYESTFWQKASPFSGFFGRFLIRSLDPANAKPMKTTGKAQPSQSEIGGDIVERFADHQRQLAEAIDKLPVDLDLDLEKTMVTSPLLGIVTYSLADTLTFVPAHCRRHLDQAKRVVELAEFPS